MSKIPHSQGVRQAIRSVRTATKKAIKGLNQKAGQLMSRGDYERAQALAACGRSLHQFVLEVDALRDRWKTLSSGGPKGRRSDRLPQWEYYQPVLNALVQAGGEATASSLEPLVEKLLDGRFGAGDRIRNSRGIEKWRVMIKRSRRHMASEGWIEQRKGSAWRITDSGRRASASKQPLRGDRVG
jgi:hypothetical protein